jgi:hypothetical protein
VSVRHPMSCFRPRIRFSVDRSWLTTGLFAAGLAASAVIAGAHGAHAATAGAVRSSAVRSSAVRSSAVGPGAVKASSAKPGTGSTRAGTSSVKAGTSSTRAGVSVAKARAKGAAARTKVRTRAAAQQDYTFYDSTTPSEIPGHRQIATYADGDYAVERSSVSDPGQVIWIDTDGHDANADALDVEPGDATPAEVAGWVKRRLTAHPGAIAIVYTMRSDWPAAKASVDTLPARMRASVRWWIADPTGHPHILPGAQATQWYWGDDYDISTAEPGF